MLANRAGKETDSLICCANLTQKKTFSDQCANVMSEVEKAIMLSPVRQYILFNDCLGRILFCPHPGLSPGYLNVVNTLKNIIF